MKVAVMSDSHDNTDNIEKAAEIANRYNCGMLFHLGDLVSPDAAERLNLFNGLVKGVFGNCDSQQQEIQRIFNCMGGEIEQPPLRFEMEGKNIVMLHEPYNLDQLVEEQHSDFIFYGHLHKVDYRKIGGTYVLNPGETGGWFRKPGFFIVDIAATKFEQIEL